MQCVNNTKVNTVLDISLANYQMQIYVALCFSTTQCWNKAYLQSLNKHYYIYMYKVQIYDVCNEKQYNFDDSYDFFYNNRNVAILNFRFLKLVNNFVK